MFHRADAERRSISEKIQSSGRNQGAKQTQSSSYFYSQRRLADVPQHPLFLSQNVWSDCVWVALPGPWASGKLIKENRRLFCAAERESESCTPLLEKTASQSGPQTVFQLFERSGKSTLGVIVPVHSGGSRPTSLLSGLADGLCARLPPITPTPSENIIDLDIKRGRAALNKIPCMFNSPTWFWRPDTFFPVRVSVTRWTVLAVTTS